MAGSGLLGRRQRFELLQHKNVNGAVSTDHDDIVGLWHLQDQVPIVGNSHELVLGRLAKKHIEGVVDLHDIEDDALRAIVLRHQESDSTMWDDGAQTHSREWA
jgi:hypothetical protein